MPPELVLRPERPADAAAVEALYAVAFGPGRHARLAAQLRQGTTHDPLTSFVADRGRVVGAIRQTRVHIGDAPAYLLGPLAVAETAAKQGIGRTLLAHSIAAARTTRAQAIVLIGDLPFYGAVGFERASHEIAMPGPVEHERILRLPLSGRPCGLVRALAWD